MEINNKQCADSARCTSTEEWINAAAKAIADILAYHQLRIICAALNEGWTKTPKRNDRKRTKISPLQISR